MTHHTPAAGIVRDLLDMVAAALYLIILIAFTRRKR